MDMDRHLVETATKIVTTRNEAGDIVYGATSSRPCLYRDISSIQRGQNREYTELDGLLWFQADEDVHRGDIYYHASEGHLRIERVVRAKSLVRGGGVNFIKCEVTRQRQIS
jgi:hypothetical protein